MARLHGSPGGEPPNEATTQQLVVAAGAGFVRTADGLAPDRLASRRTEESWGGAAEIVGTAVAYARGGGAAVTVAGPGRS
ncbi:hypothetical protein WMF31_26560 [Sorangium sp. So ce1036]|uniref:hypothetical protein n=1 Tax=Sorangium sp. So ce1036 TaxID=3133328 RepID=UPI003F112A16